MQMGASVLGNSRLRTIAVSVKTSGAVVDSIIDMTGLHMWSELKSACYVVQARRLPGTEITNGLRGGMPVPNVARDPRHRQDRTSELQPLPDTSTCELLPVPCCTSNRRDRQLHGPMELARLHRAKLGQGSAWSIDSVWKQQRHLSACARSGVSPAVPSCACQVVLTHHCRVVKAARSSSTGASIGWAVYEYDAEHV
jgi:hypothetical protein